MLLVLLVRMLLMLVVVVMVHYSRPGMVRRMMIWRWQALGWVGMMLIEEQCQQRCRRNDGWKQDAMWVTTMSTICAGDKRRIEMVVVGVRGGGKRIA
jgi:hypothetical protein